MRSIKFLILFCLELAFTGLTINANPLSDEVKLFEGFQNPPASARPFVRWWWNGNHIEAEELKREIDLLSKIGFGGVEIDPIAMPNEAKDIGTEAVVWMSGKWIELLNLACETLHEKGMLADLICGSGWPFGGEFLKDNQTLQLISPVVKSYRAGEVVHLDTKELYRPSRNEKLFFLTLVPHSSCKKGQVIDLMPLLDENQVLEYVIPPTADYDLIAGVHYENFRKVGLGAVGASGPVMDHYRKEITALYLTRMDRISQYLEKPLSELIRALFCDSLELGGSNWTTNFAALFYETYHYRLEPFYPFIFFLQTKAVTELEPSFEDEVKRARYDFCKLLVDTYLENFTKVFNQYCHDNQVLCRYQAYGGPLLRGLSDGNLIADIPEGNNWLMRNCKEDNSFSGVWNLYAAAGARFSGSKIVSCESMTSAGAKNVTFQVSLQTIKAHDDMNFISGINHTILHGYNYSPLQAGFPGWVRFGTYFSEQNTWWPYLKHWVDYNARISYVFQESHPEKSWALLLPDGQRWSEYGLRRKAFHQQPNYYFHLWESFSAAGSSLEYVGERMLQQKADYKAIMLCDVESLSPETTAALEKYVHNGGKLVLVNTLPTRSLTMQDGKTGDEYVRKTFADLLVHYVDRVFLVKNPQKNLLSWSCDLLRLTGVEPDVKLDTTHDGVYQIHAKRPTQDVYFFVNSRHKQYADFTAVFPLKDRRAWIWNPEDGSRRPYPVQENSNELKIHLGPLESMLLVFESNDVKINDSTMQDVDKPLKNGSPLMCLKPWQLNLCHVNGEKATRSLEALIDFRDCGDAFLETFAGVVEYQTTFTASGDEQFFVLGDVNDGVTEVYLNDKKVGLNWYGTPCFKIADAVVKGENTLKIKYTSLLSNYCQSLKDNPMVYKWTQYHTPISNGLMGEIKLYD